MDQDCDGIPLVERKDVADGGQDPIVFGCRDDTNGGHVAPNDNTVIIVRPAFLVTNAAFDHHSHIICYLHLFTICLTSR